MKRFFQRGSAARRRFLSAKQERTAQAEKPTETAQNSVSDSAAGQPTSQVEQSAAPQKPLRSSLKWTMLAVVLGCWVLPLVLLVAGSAEYIGSVTERQARETILQSANAAAQITVTRLEAALSASIKASYLPTIKDAWQQYKQDGDSVLLYERATTFLNQQYKYDDKFLSTVLLRTDGSEDYYYAVNTSNGGMIWSMRKYVSILRDQVLEISKTLGTELAFLCVENYCFMIRNLLDSNYESYGVLMMELNTDAVFDSMRGVTWATDTVVWLNGTPLCIEGSMPETVPARPQSGITYAREGSRYTLRGVDIRRRINLGYQVQGSTELLESQLAIQRIILGGIAVLLVPLLGSILVFLYRKVNRPVGALMAAAAQIEQGKFGCEVKPGTMTSREFGYLGNSFNRMSQTLQNQFERIYKEELALRDAKIMALQSQINPHFLNNTLEIINWEARLAENIKVCRMLESLSTMLNAAMDRKNRPLVHLSEEMMYVDAYLYIIRERLGRRLRVEKEIAADVQDCYVPRLMLQPVIENAVEHGINPTQHGTIILRAYRIGDMLYLEVENDGVTTYDDLMRIQNLLSDEPAPDGAGSTSLGIRNVNQRLKIIYGETSGLSITITKEGNTLSRICILLAEDTNNVQ